MPTRAARAVFRRRLGSSCQRVRVKTWPPFCTPSPVILIYWFGGLRPADPKTTPGLGPAYPTARERGALHLGSPPSAPGPLGSQALLLPEPLGSSGEGSLSLPESLSRRLICLIKRRVFGNFWGGDRGGEVCTSFLVLPGSRLQPRPCSFCQGARCCRNLQGLAAPGGLRGGLALPVVGHL